MTSQKYQQLIDRYFVKLTSIDTKTKNGIKNPFRRREMRITMSLYFRPYARSDSFVNLLMTFKAALSLM